MPLRDEEQVPNFGPQEDLDVATRNYCKVRV